MNDVLEGVENKISIAVGRFQVSELTKGHKDLLSFIANCGFNSNYIILGVSPLKCTKNNPLNFEARKRMLQFYISLEMPQVADKFNILYLEDNRSDEQWVKNLDHLADTLAEGRSVVMIGSRDSFLNTYTFYKGQHEVYEYTPTVFTSGRAQRDLVSKPVSSGVDWRAGIIYATQNRYPTVYSTIDVALFRDNTYKQLYLARKPGEEKWRFIGGFVDVKDASLIQTVRRETREEAGCDIDDIKYLDSFMVDDWRYRSETDKIMTHFHTAIYSMGKIKASDDIDEIQLFNLEKNEIDCDNIVPEHIPLFRKLMDWLTQRNG